MAYIYTACAVRVTIFSTGSKFRPVSNFTELHAFTLAARSYALLSMCMLTYISEVLEEVNEVSRTFGGLLGEPSYTGGMEPGQEGRVL